MSDKSGLPPIVPAIVFSLLIGGIGGFYVRYFGESHSTEAVASTAGGGPGGTAGGRGGGGGGTGGGQQPSPGMTLARLVRNLATVEEVQNKGLTPQQAQTIVPILKSLQSADKLADKDAEAKTTAINAALAEPQKQALEVLQPPGGRGGGGARGGGPPGMMSAGM